MRIKEKELFKIEGNRVKKYTIDNENGLIVSILNLGGTILEIKTKDKLGELENIVLRYEDIKDYIDNPSYYGRTIGRTSGRIDKGEFTLNGEKYTLNKNYGKNSGHGGNKGFDKIIFDSKIIEKEDSIILSLEYFSKDLEEGYPGNLKVKIEYEITEDNRLIFRVFGKSDKDTLLNITNHSYFNLSGNYKRDILNHSLKISAKKFLEIDKDGGVTGNILDINKNFDFNFGKLIGRDIENKDIQLNLGNGYDHPFMLTDKKIIELYEKESGRYMKIKTSYPSVVVYTQNFIDNKKLYGGKEVKRRMGVCLEVQNPPIGYNEAFKEYSVLKKEDIFIAETEYIFGLYS